MNETKISSSVKNLRQQWSPKVQTNNTDVQSDEAGQPLGPSVRLPKAKRSVDWDQSFHLSAAWYSSLLLRRNLWAPPDKGSSQGLCSSSLAMFFRTKILYFCYFKWKRLGNSWKFCSHLPRFLLFSMSIRPNNGVDGLPRTAFSRVKVLCKVLGSVIDWCHVQTKGQRMCASNKGWTSNWYE